MSHSELDRIRLLIGYNLKKTYTENLSEQNLTNFNKKNLVEQSEWEMDRRLGIERKNMEALGLNPSQQGDILKYRQIQRGNSNAWIEEYKKNCKNNPNLLIPTTNKYGAEGEDVIIKTDVEIPADTVKSNNSIKEQSDWEMDRRLGIDKKNKEAISSAPKKEEIQKQQIQFCLYRAPKIGLKNVYDAGTVPAIWISSMATPFFFTEESIEKSINGMVENIARSPESEEKGFNEEEIRKNLKNLIKPGDLSGFLEGNKNYALAAEHISGNIWGLKGYTDMTTGSFYTTPEWTDPRTPYELFIDKYGIWIQIGAAVVIAVVGAATGGAAWVLYAEIATESILGMVVAQREFETGKYVSGTFSLIFGFLPIAKLLKVFRGVKPETFRSLGKKLAENPQALNSEQSFESFVKNSLSEEEGSLLRQAIQRDETTWNELAKGLEEEGVNFFSKQAKKDAIKFLEKNPNLLKDINWYKRIWAREWGVNIALMTISLVLEFSLGHVLNDEEKEKITKLYAKIPESLQKEITYNLCHESEVALQTIQNLQDNFTKVEKTQKLGQNFATGLKSYRTAAELSFNQAGVEYKETDFDPEKGNKPITPNEEKIIHDKGYVSEKELAGRQYQDLMVGKDGNLYYLPVGTNKKTNNEDKK